MRPSAAQRKKNERTISISIEIIDNSIYESPTEIHQNVRTIPISQYHPLNIHQQNKQSDKLSITIPTIPEEYNN
uniref:Uncharacterized protein n=1 Tax=Rhizophagus irregularis (strain DAOM 181602 / DAOM 197198 / MUCL 43194) TaxID=747089 RepID=U9T4M8_RHIID